MKNEHICACCGRKLKTEDISILGEGTKVYCGNSICRGQALFLFEARKRKQIIKVRELLKECKSPEEKLFCQEMIELAENMEMLKINWGEEE